MLYNRSANACPLARQPAQSDPGGAYLGERRPLASNMALWWPVERPAMKLTGALDSDLLTSFWSRYCPANAPFVHPEDEGVVLRLPHDNFTTVEQLVSSDRFGSEGSRLELGLIPAPYAGDLTRAEIFVLMLNPGFSAADLYGEGEVPEYRDAMLRTLHQDLSDEEFPFIHLNPRFCWSGGYRWWEKKLRDLALALIADEGSYYNALRKLSQRIAAIELMPYHSLVCASSILPKLRSVRLAKEYVQDVLVPCARRREIALVVTRQAKAWLGGGFKPTGDIVVYDAAHARGASLSIKSAGGVAILKRLRVVT